MLRSVTACCQSSAWCAILRTSATHPMTSLQLQAFNAGFAVVDMGKTGQQIQGFRFLVKRQADNAIFHENTAKAVRALFA